jgi:hypothetical protein
VFLPFRLQKFTGKPSFLRVFSRQDLQVRALHKAAARAWSTPGRKAQEIDLHYQVDFHYLSFLS